MRGGAPGSYAAARSFSALRIVDWLSLPLTRRELSTSWRRSSRAVSEAARDFLGPPYFLSEKYLVKVDPARLRQRRHPWKAVVS